MHEWLRIKMNTTSQSYLPMWFQYVKTPHLFIVPKWNKCLNWTFIAFYWEIYLISWKKKKESTNTDPALNYNTHIFFSLRSRPEEFPFVQSTFDTPITDSHCGQKCFFVFLIGFWLEQPQIVLFSLRTNW